MRRFISLTVEVQKLNINFERLKSDLAKIGLKTVLSMKGSLLCKGNDGQMPSI